MKQNQLIAFIFLLVIGSNAIAQNNDCIDALPICTTSAQNFPSGNSGAGTADPGLNLGCATESQSSWYYFTVTTGGTLAFVIDPANNSTDYDWALYLSPYGSPATPATDCNGSNELGAPVRCNFSATAGNTGLSTTATNASEGAGGSSFSTTLAVTTGQVYYIMINNFSGDGYPFTFSANTGNTAVLSCTGVVAPTSPCTCTGPTCNNAFHATEAAANSENSTITTGADCTVFSPVIPVETDGSTDMTFCADYTIPAGTTLAAFTSTGQYKFVSGGTCAGTILSRSVYNAGSCGTALTPTGTLTAGGLPTYAVTPTNTYVFCQTIRLAGPDCLQYNSSCINVFTVPAPPANDQCAGAIAIACASSTIGTTINATTTNDPTVTCNGETVDAPGVWYTYNPGVTPQNVTLDTDNATTNYDTKIHVYTAASCAGPFTCVAADDDAGTGTTSLTSFAAAASTTYYILVNGASGATGNFALDINCTAAPVNDACSGALTLTCGGTLTGQNNTAATSTEDGLVCGTTVGATSRGMWYKFVGDGRIATITTTALTGSEITVWTGSDCSSLTCLSGVLGTTHTFTAEAGTTYYVLASTNAGGASAAFSIGLTCATPAYNVGGGTTGGGTAFCNNNIYSGSTSALPTNTLVITALAGTLRDPGGTGSYPNNYDDRLGTASATIICPNGGDGGTTTFTFSSFNTENTFDFVYVYDGPNFNYPQVPGSPFTGTSIPSSIISTNAAGCLTFEFLSNGSTVAVGFEGTWSSTGDTGVDLVANDDCTNAISVGVECPTVSGTNINATPSCSDPTPAFFSAVTIENTVWYKFFVSSADAGSTVVTLSNIICPDFANTLITAASRGLQFGIYDAGLTDVCPSAAINGTTRVTGGTVTNPGPASSPAFTTVAGHYYYIGIDGASGSSCDFDITIDRYATNFAVNSATSGSYSYACDAAPAQTADVALTLSGGRTTGYSVTVVPSSISVTNSGSLYTLNNIPDGTTWTATATDGLCTQIISGVYSYDATCNPCPSYSKSNITLTPTTSTVCAGQTVTFNTLAVDAARSVPTVRAATLGGRKYGDGVGGVAPLNYVADYKKYIHLLPVTMTAATIGNGVADAQVNGLDFTINAKWNDMYIVLKNTSCAGSVVIWNGVNNTAFAGGTDATVSTGSTTLTYSAATGLFTPNTSISSYSSTATLAAMNTAFAGCDPEGFYLEINDQSNAVLQYSINNLLFSLTDKTTTAVTPTSTLTNIAWVGSGAATGGVSGSHTNVGQLALSNSDKNANFTAPACAGPGNCDYTYTVTGKDVNGCTVTGTATITVTPPDNYVNDITLCAGAAASSFSSTASCTGTVTGTATGTSTATNTLVNGTPRTINLPVSGVPAGATITDVNVSVTIAHNFSSDVVLSIASPATTSVALTNGTAGGSNNLGNTSGTITTASTGAVATYVFDEDVAAVVWPATDPIPAGSYNPTGNLNTYDGTSSINGTWVLSASDDAGGDDGVITGVTVTIAYSYPVAVEWYTVATGGTAVQTGTTFNPINDAEVLAAGAPYSSLTNTNTPGVYTFYTGCTGSTCREAVTYTINSRPVITAGLTQAICSGTAASRTITLSTDLPGTETFAWGAPTMTAGITGGVAGSGSSITDVLSNSGTTAGTATYTVTVTADAADGGCTNTANVVITVNPNPTITLSSSSTSVCSGTTSATLAYSATTGSPNQYSVDYDATAEGQGFVDVTNSTLPATPITLTVPSGAAPGTYNATITVRNSTTGCVSTTYNVTVTVNPLPTITLSSTSTSVCAGGTSATLAYTATTDSPNQYSIDFNAAANTVGFTDVTNSALPASPITITVPAGAAPNTYTGTITGRNSTTGCISSSTTITVVVNPLPTITLSSSTTNVCAGGTSATLAYTGTTNTPDQYSLDFNATAEGQGFIDVSNSTLPASPITITVPAGAAAGSYTATLTVRNSTTGCVSSTTTVTVVVNALPTITLSSTSTATCSGSTSATIAYTATTGTPNQYSVDYDATAEGQGFVDVSNSALPASPITLTVPSGAVPGTYNATITVRNSTTGCVSTTYNVTVTVNPLPTITLGTSPVICSGTTTANLPYTATTNSPNQYSIDFNAAANTAGLADVALTALPASPIAITVPSGIEPGTYSGTITVRNSTTTCSSTAVPFTIQVDATPSITSVTTACTGMTYDITVNATTASGSLEYSLDGGSYQASNVFTGLASGSTHSVTVRTVGTTCTATQTGVTRDCSCVAPPSVTITETSVDVCGTAVATFNYTVANGPAAVTETGGGTLSTTTLNNGTGTFTYTPVAGDIGTTVTVTATIPDPDGIGACTSSTDAVNVVVKAIPTITVGTLTNPTTCGGTNGSIALTFANVPDGTYTVTFTGGAGSASVTVAGGAGTISGLAAGTYSNFQITANGCTSVAGGTATLNNPATPTITVGTLTNPTTCGGTNGSIALTFANVPDGTYTVTFTGGAGSASVTVAGGAGTISGLAAGTYSNFQITANGCTSVAGGTATLSDPITPSAPTTTVTTQPTCATATGTITVTAPATGAGISYTVTGTSPVVAGVTQATTTFAGLAAGVYDVITTVNGCTSLPTSLTVNAQPTPPAAATASTTIQPTCALATGTVVVTAPTGAVEYNIDGGTYQASGTFAGVAAGPHTILVRSTTDNTCVSSGTSVTVNAQPTAPAAATASTTIQPTCALATGTVVVTAPTGAVEYNIDGGTYQASGTFAGVAAGPHTILVRSTTDNTCVSSSTSVTVNAQPTAPAAATASTTIQPTCALATGTVVVTAPTGAVEYNIDGGTYQASGTFAGVAAGPHTILVRSTTDNTCVSSSTSVTVNAQPTAPAAATASTTIQPTCALATGTVVVTAPTGAVEYNIDGGTYQASGTFAGVAAGPHTILVRSTTDNTCVSSSTSVTVNAQPTAPAAATASTTIQPTCALATGTVVVTAPTGAVEYNIDGGTYQASGTFAGVAAGPHTILVRSTTDNTCVSSGTSVTVNPQPATPTITSTPTTCSGTTYNITVNATVTSGTLEYSLDGGAYQSSNVFSGLASGSTHIVTVRTVGTTCTATATGITRNCISGIRLGVIDPCTCNNDATINNLSSGTFSESIIIGVDNDSDGTLDGDLPTGWSINALTVTGASAGLVTGLSSFTMQTNASTNGFDALKATFSHTDNVGYQVSFEVLDTGGIRVDANGDSVVDNNDIITIANKCAYPTPIFSPTVPASICSTATPITLGATDIEPGNPGGTAAFTLTTVGGTAITQTPTIAGLYTIVLNYDGANDASTNSGLFIDPSNTTAVAAPNGGQAGSTLGGLTTPGFPGCIQPISTAIDVQDCCAPNQGTW